MARVSCLSYKRQADQLGAAELIEHKGGLYWLIQDGQTLKIVAMDERGLLVESQGDQIMFISEKLTEADHQHFQAQRQQLEAKQQKTQQPTQPHANVKKSKGVERGD